MRNASFNIFLMLLVLLSSFVLSCSNKGAILRKNALTSIKHYQRIIVTENRNWTQSRFSVCKGDVVLIILSDSKRSTAPSQIRHPYEPPNLFLNMKIGNEDHEIAAIGPGFTNFFCSPRSGQLKFGVSLRREFYSFFQLDVFVFRTADEQIICRDLGIVAKQNPHLINLSKKLYSFTHSIQPIYQTIPSRIIIDNMDCPNSEKSGIARIENEKVLENNFNTGKYLKPFSSTKETGRIFTTAFHPSGHLFLTGDNENTLHLWETDTGRKIRIFTGHTDYINSVSFSNDGKYALSASEDATIGLWGVNSGKLIKVLKGHTYGVTNAIFSPDDKFIISGSNDNKIFIWNANSGKIVRRLIGHKNSITFLSISSKGDEIVSAGDDKYIRIWDAIRGTLKKSIKVEGAYISALSFNSYMNTVYFSQTNDIIKVLNLKTGKIIRKFDGHNSVVNALISCSNGTQLISGGDNNLVALLDSETGRIIQKIKGDTAEINSIVVSPNGRFFLTGSSDGTCHLWHKDTGKIVRYYSESSKSVTAVACSPDSRYVISGNKEGDVQLWDLKTAIRIKEFSGHRGEVRSVAFNNSGNLAFSAGVDSKIYLWDVQSGKKLKEFKGHEGAITSAVFSVNSQQIYSSGEDHTLREWYISTDKQSNITNKEAGIIQNLSLSRNKSGYLLSCEDREDFDLWDLKKEMKIQFNNLLFEDYQSTGSFVSFCPEGRYVISGGNDNSIRLWEVNTENAEKHLKRFYQGHTDKIVSVSFSPDGREFISGSEDNTIRIWEIEQGKEVGRLTGHTAGITSVAYSPDGNWIVSGARDGSVRLWSSTSKKEVVSLYTLEGGEWACVTPDGYYSCSHEGSTSVYWIYPNSSESFSYEQFESLFNRPDIIKERLSNNPEAGKPVPTLSRPPQIDLADHMTIKETQSLIYELPIVARSTNRLKTIRVFVNSRPIKEANFDTNIADYSFNVPLFSGANRITVIAYDENGFSSNPKWVDVICDAREIPKPNLFIVGLGISNYPKLPFEWQLEFADTDAKMIIKEFQKQEGKIFGKVNSKLITNNQVIVDNLLNVFDELSFLSENDIIIILIAGHGIRDNNGTFFFLTSLSELNNPYDKSLNWEIMAEQLSRFKARTILLLDACHSGSIVTETIVPNDDLANEFFSGNRGGVMVFSASKGRQFSLESPDIGKGAGIFTYAISQCVGAKSKIADINGNGYVEFSELVGYVRNYVDQETNGEQTPWLSRKELFGDLPIAVVKH